MKNLAFIVAALLPCACATTLPTASTAVRDATYYCWKERLAAEGDRLACNWQPSRGDACRLEAEVSMPKSAFVGAPQDAGRCANGQWLVKAIAARS